MSFFSATLDSLRRDHQLTQFALAVKVSLTQGQISSYLSERTRPDKDTLTRLAQAFGKDGTQLVVAFLRDEIPEPFQNAISIDTAEKQASKRDAPAQRYLRLGPSVRAVIDEAIYLSSHSHQFLATLESIVELARPDEL